MATSKLRDYRAKRNFSKTEEPLGSVADEGGNRFVVHKHAATSDHYDLRLQVGNILKSWAVPKGPSLNPADKRLAVQTEDHPLEYIDFEGVIPKGEYGGGAMIVWDAGVWAPMDDPEKSLEAGAFKFRLAGEKLNGTTETIETAFKTGTEALKANFEKAVKGYDQILGFQKDTVEAYVKAANVAGKGAETLHNEIYTYSKASIEGGIANAKALMSTKSAHEAFELQMRVVDAAVDHPFAESFRDDLANSLGANVLLASDFVIRPAFA